MSSQRWRVAGTLAVMAVSAAGSGCAGGRSGGTVSGAAGPIEVSGVPANLLGLVRFEGQADLKAATVHFGGPSAQVTADRVQLPGGRVVPIPAGCKAVEVREAAGGMRVFLDGIEAR